MPLLCVCDFQNGGNSDTPTSPQAPAWGRSSPKVPSSSWEFTISCSQQRTIRREKSFLPRNNVIRVFRHVMRNRFHADFYATSGLRGIQISKLEKECSGRFHNPLRWRVRRLIHAAFVAGKPQHARCPRTPRRNFGSPHNLICVAAVGGRPHIRNIEYGFHPFFSQIFLKQPIQ